MRMSTIKRLISGSMLAMVLLGAGAPAAMAAKEKRTDEEMDAFHMGAYGLYLTCSVAVASLREEFPDRITEEEAKPLIGKWGAMAMVIASMKKRDFEKDVEIVSLAFAAMTRTQDEQVIVASLQSQYQGCLDFEQMLRDEGVDI